jgi:hypothetical protein
VSTYTAEADHLHREYNRAVGYALQYGILTYHPRALGAPAKTLGTLRDEIRDHEHRHGITDGLFPPPPPHRSLTDGHVQAYCLSGHPMTLWGNSPMMGPPGDVVRWGAAEFRCHCGQTARYGRRHLR